jgi:hypothetical protein
LGGGAVSNSLSDSDSLEEEEEESDPNRSGTGAFDRLTGVVPFAVIDDLGFFC